MTAVTGFFSLKSIYTPEVYLCEIFLVKSLGAICQNWPKNGKFAIGTGFFGRIEASKIGTAMVAASASSKAVSVLNTFKCKWEPLNH